MGLITMGAACLAQSEYYPLQRGDQWVYRARGPAGGVIQLEVTSAAELIGGNYYAKVEGLFDGTVWLRVRNDGMLVAYDAASKLDVVWAAFGIQEKGVYQPAFDTCTGIATVASRSAAYHGPLGDADSGLRITFAPGRCADAGRQEEFYLPYIGPISWTENTIAGPRTYDLVYARLGGVTVLTTPEVAFGVSIGPAATGMMARIALRQTLTEPLRLTFRSSQTFELLIRDSAGTEVYRWSRGRIFAPATRDVTFAPGEKNWVALVPQLPAGKYTAEASLVTVEPRSFVATAGFEVR